MDNELPTAAEAAADIFHRVLQETEIQHAFEVLLTLIVCVLDGNSSRTKLRFLRALHHALDIDPGTQTEVQPATTQAHDQYVFLAGWNPGEREPN